MLGGILFLSLGFFLCAERNAFNGRAINCGDRSVRRNNRYKVSDFKLAVKQNIVEGPCNADCQAKYEMESSKLRTLLTRVNWGQ